VFNWKHILNLQKVIAHAIFQLPEVLDLGNRALRKRLNKTRISSVFDGAFNGAGESLDNNATLDLLDNKSLSKDTHLNSLGNNDKYLINIISSNTHRVADSSKIICSYPYLLVAMEPIPSIDEDDEPEDLEIISKVRKAMPKSFTSDPDIKHLFHRKPGKIKRFLRRIKRGLGQFLIKRLNKGLGATVEYIRWFIKRVLGRVWTAKLIIIRL
jgi:hypothetical protein